MADDRSTTHDTARPALSGFGQFFNELSQFVIARERERKREKERGVEVSPIPLEISRATPREDPVQTEKCTRPRESDNPRLAGSGLFGGGIRSRWEKGRLCATSLALWSTGWLVSERCSDPFLFSQLIYLIKSRGFVPPSSSLQRKSTAGISTNDYYCRCWCLENDQDAILRAFPYYARVRYLSVPLANRGRSSFPLYED